MPRASKNQWDFGELFPPEETRRVLTVRELTTQVKRLMEQQLGAVWVTGEVTNLRQQSSGHIYFSLKDEGTQVACVLFRGVRLTHRELLEDGRKVLLQGDLTVYESRGQYQILVRQLELKGVGALQAAFEKLKQKLAEEGLFDEERKRPLPSYPQCIGVVTSSTAAALRDILHVVERRNPSLRMILAPCRVQGEGAAQEIADAIRLLNEFSCLERQPETAQHDSGSGRPVSGLDVILVTRGGGSLEDLWAFNEEVVARAIATSSVPVVSAVGHEIDFTISDFVADLRAATPSAAAEILTEGVFSATDFISEASERLREAAFGFLAEARDDLHSIVGRMGRAHPRRRLNEVAQRLDDLQSSVGRSARESIRRADLNRAHVTERFLRCRPASGIKDAREEISRKSLRLKELAWRSHRILDERLKGDLARLQLLSPRQVLSRGYSITTDAVTGKVVRDSGEVKAGQEIETRLHKGTLTSRVEPPRRPDGL